MFLTFSSLLNVLIFHYVGPLTLARTGIRHRTFACVGHDSFIKYYFKQLTKHTLPIRWINVCLHT